MCKHLLQVGFPIIMTLVTHLLLGWYKLSNLFRGIMSAHRRRAGKGRSQLVLTASQDQFHDSSLASPQQPNTYLMYPRGFAKWIILSFSLLASHVIGDTCCDENWQLAAGSRVWMSRAGAQDQLLFLLMIENNRGSSEAIDCS